MLYKIKEALHKFMKFQATGGILLLIVTICAVFLANSSFSGLYHHFLELPIIGTGLHMEHFVNDALMPIFFLLVSLEVKREVLEGQLSTKAQRMLPIVGALGGVVVPAVFYIYFNYGIVISETQTIRGWAIPTATDIAFALGVLSLFGDRVPLSLKAFLTALAIIDDLIAIVIIALVYNNHIDYLSLITALSIFVILIILNKNKIYNIIPYLILGFVMWYFIMNSGIHATIAGVLLGLTIPLKGKNKKQSPLKSLEHKIHPWASFFILPIFAFCNAGISLGGVSIESIFSNPISLGIIFGLFIGKQLGVFFAVYILIKTKIIKMPIGSTWPQIYGISVLTGIGFTMSIFIGNLAFTTGNGIENNVRVGIIVGSLLSAVIGYIVLAIFCNKKKTNK